MACLVPDVNKGRPPANTVVYFVIITNQMH